MSITVSQKKKKDRLLQHGSIWKTLCQVKEASHKGLHTI